MKNYNLSITFYTVFILALLYPAIYLSNITLMLINFISIKNAYINNLINLGILDFLTPVTLLLLFFYITNHWLWKLINKVLGIPIIEGRYGGILKSTYTEDGSHNIILEIEQTLTQIKIYFYAEKSQSWSIVSGLFKNELGNWAMYYIYENKTRVIGDNSDMKDHEGVSIVDINGKSLSGYYFNDLRNRGNYGNFNVNFINKKLLRKYKG